MPDKKAKKAQFAPFCHNSVTIFLVKALLLDTRECTQFLFTPVSIKRLSDIAREAKGYY